MNEAPQIPPPEKWRALRARMNTEVRNDRIFIAILICLVMFLAGTSIYLGTARAPGDDEFFQNFVAYRDRFQAEYDLQNANEKVAPGAVHVPIIIYHSVRPHRALETSLVRRYVLSPESLEAELKYLKEHGYTVISLEYLADTLKENVLLPQRSVVLTFDDGWQSQYRYAFPLLKKYGATATFFIFTNAIDHAHFLTWNEVKEMDAAGMTIGGHTRSHPYLIQISDDAILRNEIIGGKSIIEDHLKKPIDLFAYPFGHYTDKIIKIVKEAGYQAARSTYKGTHHIPQDLYTLKGVEATDDLGEFVKDLGEGS